MPVGMNGGTMSYIIVLYLVDFVYNFLMVQQLNFSALLFNSFNLHRHSSEKHNSEVFQIYFIT